MKIDVTGLAQVFKWKRLAFVFDSLEQVKNIFVHVGSGCGSVGRAVASDGRGPRFESSHRQNDIEQCLLSTVLKRQKINKKRPGIVS